MCNRPNGKEETPNAQPISGEALELTCLGSPMPAPALRFPGPRKWWERKFRGSVPRVQEGKHRRLVEFGFGEIHLWVLIHEPGKEKCKTEVSCPSQPSLVLTLGLTSSEP